MLMGSVSENRTRMMKLGIWMVIVMPCLGMKRALLDLDLNELPPEELPPDALSGVHSFSGQLVNHFGKNGQPSRSSTTEYFASCASSKAATVFPISSRLVNKHPLTNRRKKQKTKSIHQLNMESSKAPNSGSIEPAYKNKDVIESGHDGYPGLTFIDFPPSHLNFPDHKIIFEATRSLKLKDGELFFERYAPNFGTSHKIPHLASSISIWNFYHVPERESRPVEAMPHGKHQKCQRYDRTQSKEYEMEKQLATKNYQKEEIQTIENYADLVRSEFHGERDAFLTKLEARKALVPRAQYKLEESQSKKLLQALPLYFLFVDLINTLMVVGKTEDARKLESGRKLAGKVFFDLIDRWFFPEEGHLLNPGLTIAFKQFNHYKRKHVRPHLLWMIVLHWLESNEDPPIQPNKLTRYFKNFINDILKCFMEKFSKTK